MKLTILNPELPANVTALLHAVEDATSHSSGFFLTHKTRVLTELVVDMDDILVMEGLCGFLYAMAKTIQYAVYDQLIKQGRVRKEAVTPKWYRTEISKELCDEKRRCLWYEVDVVRNMLGIMAQNQSHEGYKSEYTKRIRQRFLSLAKIVCSAVDLEDICDEARTRPFKPGPGVGQKEGV